MKGEEMMKKDVEERRRVSIRLPRELHIAAKHAADMENKTFTEYVIEALEKKMGKDG